MLHELLRSSTARSSEREEGPDMAGKESGTLEAGEGERVQG